MSLCEKLLDVIVIEEDFAQFFHYYLCLIPGISLSFFNLLTFNLCSYVQFNKYIDIIYENYPVHLYIMDTSDL